MKTNRDFVVLLISGSDYDILINKKRRVADWVHDGNTAIKVVQRLTKFPPETLSIANSGSAHNVLKNMGIEFPMTA
jgi:hypothetical protein